MSGPLLSRGDRVGIVATGFAAAPEALDAGVAWIGKRGFVPVAGLHLKSVFGYFAGDDAARAADLDAAIADKTLAAIWFARGGYGTARLLDRIDLARLAKRPKLLLGYSDLTALFGALLARAATVCLHAPGAAELSKPTLFHAPSLAAALAGRTQTLRLTARGVLSKGQAGGRLMGGNLTVLVHLLGTRHMPDLSGSVVFLEETGEEAYRVDRLLQHLTMSGALKGARAILLGHFHAPPTARLFPGDRDVADVIREHLLPLGIPVVAGIPSGHGPGKWTLPIGGTATLDTERRVVTLDPHPALRPSRRG